MKHLGFKFDIWLYLLSIGVELNILGWGLCCLNVSSKQTHYYICGLGPLWVFIQAKRRTTDE